MKSLYKGLGNSPATLGYIDPWFNVISSSRGIYLHAETKMYDVNKIRRKEYPGLDSKRYSN
jgi:hypothetical protein